MKMYYIHTMEYCSATRRNGTGSFVETPVDAESATQTEVKSEGEKQILDINAYRTVEAEQQYRWTYFSGRNRHTDLKNGPADMGWEWQAGGRLALTNIHYMRQTDG